MLLLYQCLSLHPYIFRSLNILKLVHTLQSWLVVLPYEIICGNKGANGAGENRQPYSCTPILVSFYFRICVDFLPTEEISLTTSYIYTVSPHLPARTHVEEPRLSLIAHKIIQGTFSFPSSSPNPQGFFLRLAFDTY